MAKRVFLIVLDSVGIGEMPDAFEYGDEGSNTLKASSTSVHFSMPNMKRLGLFNIDGVNIGEKVERPEASFARMTEKSKGKDTTIGHWEIAGVIYPKPLPTYPEGFPKEILDEFRRLTGRGILCNLPYSGTSVIDDFGEEHMKTGNLIVYTSADSVFQVAAHEGIVPIEEQYRYCQIARKLLTGEHGVGRVIARPFIGEPGNFRRTGNRHDFSLQPPKITMLDQLSEEGFDVISVGKIIDIFAEKGITEYVRTAGNEEGVDRTVEYMDRDFEGLCFTNLVDFDMLYGHRNDIDGYAKALTYFDDRLLEILDKMRDDDILMVTADHGCDPMTISTDHSREYTPLVMFGKNAGSRNYGTRDTFADIGATVLKYFGIVPKIDGTSII
ncbi:phosphopentomutase [Anaerobium acetethylicum]|uniref:Phosphopentomutase n=1 Tax=Anaerobium acetethylicum TaxID=1619234 RepID=A0A1D3TTK4_9FIRM|nr:phosphopentomutase [Anaerobium acetethylicum]SCP97259.1 phosphopentomutase [Anaerobium acetethylicum]